MRTNLSFIVAGAVLMTACGRGDTSARRDTTVSDTAGPAGALDSLTAAERALFAPLPQVFADRGVQPTPAQVDLGRMLFYETLLSGGHDVSCNTCHALNGYGADGRRVSFGSVGHTGNRNSPTVYNAAGQALQFWDGRSPSVEEQAKGPILNPDEMAMPAPGAVLDHLRALAPYRAAFRAAFPRQADPINYDNVGRALGAFERGLVTPGRWDRWLAGDGSALTPQELRGVKTFVTVGCAGCHSGALVGGGSLQRVGVTQPWPNQADSGRYRVTGKAADLFVFKVPALRNATKTGPYFHDGSVASLEEAIRLMGHHQLDRELTPGQLADIHAWLAALTGELPAAYIAQPPLPGGGQ
jgi:cytochrome c peroxidase